MRYDDAFSGEARGVVLIGPFVFMLLVVFFFFFFSCCLLGLASSDFERSTDSSGVVSSGFDSTRRCCWSGTGGRRDKGETEQQGLGKYVCAFGPVNSVTNEIKGGEVWQGGEGAGEKMKEEALGQVSTLGQAGASSSWLLVGAYGGETRKYGRRIRYLQRRFGGGGYKGVKGG